MNLIRAFHNATTIDKRLLERLDSAHRDGAQSLVHSFDALYAYCVDAAQLSATLSTSTTITTAEPLRFITAPGGSTSPQHWTHTFYHIKQLEQLCLRLVTAGLDGITFTHQLTDNTLADQLYEWTMKTIGAIRWVRAQSVIDPNTHDYTHLRAIALWLLARNKMNENRLMEASDLFHTIETLAVPEFSNFGAKFEKVFSRAISLPHRGQTLYLLQKQAATAPHITAYVSSIQTADIKPIPNTQRYNIQTACTNGVEFPVRVPVPTNVNRAHDDDRRDHIHATAAATHNRSNSSNDNNA